MPTFTIRRTGLNRRVGDGLVLRNSDARIEFPLLPDNIEFGEVAATWSQMPRPGRDPLLVREGKALKTVRFDADLQLPNRASVAEYLTKLRTLSRSSLPVRVKIGNRNRGDYRITELSLPELAWNHNGAPIEARAIVALTEASDLPARKGSVR